MQPQLRDVPGPWGDRDGRVLWALEQGRAGYIRYKRVFRVEDQERLSHLAKMSADEAITKQVLFRVMFRGSYGPNGTLFTHDPDYVLRRLLPETLEEALDWLWISVMNRIVFEWECPPSSIRHTLECVALRVRALEL
jgi:hypothetical protein